MENCKELIGFGDDKDALSAELEAGTGDSNKNLLFDSSGIISLVLDHQKDLLGADCGWI
jgi:hypothetical protein